MKLLVENKNYLLPKGRSFAFLDKGLDKLIKEGYVWALCPHCRMPLDSVDSKKCEICYKPIVKENILFKKLDKENMS